MFKGIKIKECRIAAGLTQAELAARSGTAVGTIQQYELGIRQPRIDQLSRIADALDLTIMELLDMTEEDEQEVKPKESKASPQKRKTDAKGSVASAPKSKIGTKTKKSSEKKTKADIQQSELDETLRVFQEVDREMEAYQKEYSKANTNNVTGKINLIANDGLNTDGKAELLRYALILSQDPDYSMFDLKDIVPHSEISDESENK